jgi:hypothetical protein
MTPSTVSIALGCLGLVARAAPLEGQPDDVAAALRPRILQAAAVAGEAPVIDGRLDEPAWNEAEAATNFVESRPVPGVLAGLPTEARMLYDSESLYVGIRAYDAEPLTILAPWPRRDDETTSDWLFVELDSRHDRRTAFSFGVNPRGVQADGTFVQDNVYDGAWDAVWESAASIDERGWTAEFRIPFSQLPYTTPDGQEGNGGAISIWGVNFYRHNPHRGETSNWSPRLPSLAGVVSNFNELHLRVPAHPRRLELAPFAAVDLNRVPGTNPLAEGEGLSGGLDVKAGLGSSFTFSAALRPDFSQVEADPSEVNLTTFETFFGERRPLFVESAGLFRFDAGVPFSTRGNSFAADVPFYSRRIGRAPHLALPEDVRYGSVPEASTLIGALKLTGRTASGWSVGTLFAETGSALGGFVDAGGARGTLPVEPETRFAAARVSRDFRRGASALGGFATLTLRPEMAEPLAAILPGSAETMGFDGRHRFGEERYELTGFLLGSRISGTRESLTSILHGPGHYTQRPDAPHLDSGEVGTAASGFGGQIRLAKVGGEHWRWTLLAHALSPRLELNDIGFQRSSDWLLAFGALSYQQDHPGRWFRRWSLGSSQSGWAWSFGGERRAALVDARFSFDLNNYWGGAVRFDHELASLDTDALRGGAALAVPARDELSLNLYTDSRRASQVSVDVGGYRDRDSTGRGISFSPTATLRPADRLAVTIGPSFERRVNPWQFVSSGPIRPVVARLDQSSLAITLRMDLAFSSNLTLQLYAQPFASRGELDDYREVVAPRAERPSDRFLPLDPGLRPASEPASSFAVTDLRSNLVLRWEYRPGSRLYVVWSQARHDSGADPLLRFPGDALAVFDAPPANRLLVKLSFWTPL